MNKFLEGFNEEIEKRCKGTIDCVIDSLEGNINEVKKRLPERYNEEEIELLVKGMNFSLKYIKIYKQEFHLVEKE